MLGKLKNIDIKCPHISTAACYRYFIPMLNFDYAKGIYIDCDIIVRGDISELFSFNLGDNFLAGADDFAKSNYVRNLKLTRYFNSGVLLINIAKMRRENIVAKLVAKTLELKDKIKYLDQDVLNIVLKDKVKILPSKWGAVSQLFRRSVSSDFIDESEITEAVYEPAIIHFTGPDKPWVIPFGITAHPWAPAYFYYINRTPFSKSAESFKRKFSPIKRFFWYWKRHLLFFLRPQFF